MQEQSPPSPNRTAPAAAAIDTASPDFQKAVAEATAKAVAEATPTMMAQIIALMRANGLDTEKGSGNNDWAKELALNLANLTNQSSGQKIVDPAILRAREVAREKMIGLLVKAHAEGKVARYELRDQIYFENQVINPVELNPVTKLAEQTMIDWPNIPNEAMVPVCDLAKEIHGLFVISIGNTDNPDIPRRATDFYVTNSGTVINQVAPARRTRGQVEPLAEQTSKSGFRIVRERGEGPVRTARYDAVNILGTIAAPAQQTV